MTKNAIAHYESALKEAFPSGATGDVFHHWNEARKALAEQPAQQEPVDEPQPDGVVMGFTEDGQAIVDHDGLEEGWVLYTTPPQRKPLTDEQMWELWNSQGDDAMEQQAAIAFARAIEDAHGIKE